MHESVVCRLYSHGFQVLELWKTTWGSYGDWFAQTSSRYLSVGMFRKSGPRLGFMGNESVSMGEEGLNRFLSLLRTVTRGVVWCDVMLM